jgi:hypothetical protein
MPAIAPAGAAPSAAGAGAAPSAAGAAPDAPPRLDKALESNPL